MRILLASLFATALLASTACSDDPVGADDDADDDTTSSGGSSGRASSSGGKSSSSGGKSSSSSGGRSSSGGSSSGTTTSSSSGGSGSSSGSSSGDTWPGPSGTAITAGVVPDVASVDSELLAHTVATGAADGSFVVGFTSYPAFPDRGGVTLEKHAASGALLWRKRLEYTPTSQYSSIAMDAAGNVYVAGNVSPVSGFILDGVTVPNIRKATAPPSTYIGECAVVKLAAADGVKGWHGHATLGAGVTLTGYNNVECRGLAVRDGHLVLTGVYPTKNIVWVQGGASTSAEGSQSNSSSNVSESFVVSVAADTGLGESVTVLQHTGAGAGNLNSESVAIAANRQTMLYSAAQGDAVKAGPLTYTPTAPRDGVYNPIGFLSLATSPIAGSLRASEITSTMDPFTNLPQVVALAAGGGLFGLGAMTYSQTTFRPPSAGTAATLAADRSYFVLTQVATDAAAGAVRLLDFGAASAAAPEHFLGTGPDGTIVMTGLNEGALAFGADCATAGITTPGSYLVSFGTTPMTGCKFAIALPSGVRPARAAAGADGRIFVAGLYSGAVTFAPGLTLPAPATGEAPFFASFVP